MRWTPPGQWPGHDPLYTGGVSGVCRIGRTPCLDRGTALSRSACEERSIEYKRGLSLDEMTPYWTELSKLRCCVNRTEGCRMVSRYPRFQEERPAFLSLTIAIAMHVAAVVGAWIWSSTLKSESGMTIGRELGCPSWYSWSPFLKGHICIAEKRSANELVQIRLTVGGVEMIGWCSERIRQRAWA